MQINAYLILGSMSNRRKKLPKYTVPSDEDLSMLIYLNANGDLIHMLFNNLPISGVFEWENNEGPQQDFFSEIKNSESNDDDDYDDDDEFFSK